MENQFRLKLRRMHLLLLLPLLPLASCDLFGSPPLASGPPPWEARDHQQTPTDLWGNTGFPFPTNVWWQNSVLDKGDGVAAVNPYIVKTMSDGLHVCLPEFWGGATAYGMGFADNLIMSAQEGPGTHTVTAYDELSVTVGWAENGMVAPIVRGMPYATVKYTGLTPSLRYLIVINIHCLFDRPYIFTLSADYHYLASLFLIIKGYLILRYF